MLFLELHLSSKKKETKCCDTWEIWIAMVINKCLFLTYPPLWTDEMPSRVSIPDEQRFSFKIAQKAYKSFCHV
jgi:hypothetical protein